METIEERAKKASEGYADEGYSAGLYTGYKEGATEQRTIDIEKACEWLLKNGFADEDTPDTFVCFKSGYIWDFRKAMEKAEEK